MEHHDCGASGTARPCNYCRPPSEERAWIEGGPSAQFCRGQAPRQLFVQVTKQSIWRDDDPALPDSDITVQYTSRTGHESQAFA